MKLTIPKLRDSVWKYFSKYILLRDKDKPCVTCPTHDTFNHAGHFVHGKSSKTYFDERNVNKQCVKCNLFKSGNEIVYTLYMIKTYGQNVVDELIEENHRKHIWTREELEELKEKYKNLVKEME